jgi:arylsulfatase B
MACWSQTPSGRGYSRWFGYYHHAVDYYSETLGLSSTGLVDSCYKAGHKIVDLWNSSKGADGGPETERNGTVYLEEMFLEHSLSVIAAHDARAPLFLFHAFHLMHTPLEVPSAYEAQFAFLKDKPRRLYAAMTHYMDEALGKLVAALEAKDMYKDTLIVVSSDNGGPIYALNDISGGANNLPLRGGKFSDFEGGIRVNSFVSGGFLPAKRRGQEESRYVHIADWYTTFCALAGVDAHDERAAKVGLPAVDGVDQWPVIAGMTEQPARTEIYISKYALIQDRFKIITGADLGSVVPGGKPGRWVPMAGYWPGWPAAEAEANFATKWRLCDPACLYDIHADPNEYNDLFRHNRSLAWDMIRRLNQLNEGFFGPDRGQDDPTACDTFLDKFHGFYGPFIDDRHDIDLRHDIAVQRVLEEGGEQRMAL